jgi:hypothetical protein
LFVFVGHSKRATMPVDDPSDIYSFGVEIARRVLMRRICT